MSVVRVTVSRPVIEVTANAIPVVSGGTTDHAALSSNLAWGTSGHTGTADRLAGFDGAGAAAYYTRTTALAFLGAVEVTVTPGSTTSDTTGTTVATLTLEAGNSYEIAGILVCTTALASTALNTRALAGGGLTASAVAFHWNAGQTTTFAGGSTRLDDWTPLTSGLGTTERALVVHGHLTCTASGTVEIQIRSEINGSSVAVTAGVVRLMECP